jgi:hypothetical protein
VRANSHPAKFRLPEGWITCDARYVLERHRVYAAAGSLSSSSGRLPVSFFHRDWLADVVRNRQTDNY